MNGKKILVTVMALILLLIPIMSCNNFTSTTSIASTTSTGSTTNITNTSTSSTPQESSTIPKSFIISIDFSQYPMIGQTAEVIFTVKPYAGTKREYPGLADARVYLDFEWVKTDGTYKEAKYYTTIPLSEVLINGETIWEGNIFEEDAAVNGIFFERDSVQLKSTIQLPREGIWRITGYLVSKDGKESFKEVRRVAVVDGMAVDYNALITKQYPSSPLAYLANFPYGNGGKPVLDKYHPIIVQIDISKLPLLGEEAKLTCIISSIQDFSGYDAKIRFFRFRESELPANQALVAGVLTWYAFGQY